MAGLTGRGLDQLFFPAGQTFLFSPPCDVTKRINKVSVADRFRPRGEGPADILTTSIFKSLMAKSPPFSVLTGQSEKGDSH